MIVRDVELEDLPALAALHEKMGLDYKCPNLMHPLFLVKKVAVDGDRIVGSLVLKLRAEAMLLLDGTPEEKWQAIQELQPVVLQEAWEKGLDDIDCAVPDEAHFLPKRLESQGWIPARDGWRVWSHTTEVS